ncbi:hypothetical protein JHN49_29210, partial [Streptomyces sp. MBT57]|nr:hypothetical protein [Streptomyces sp. MBT57]
GRAWPRSRGSGGRPPPLPESRRRFIVIPGVLLAGASCAVLTAGELRRADRGVAAR